MSVIGYLASSLQRQDDQPNIKLAEEIIRSKRHDWVKELVDNLNNKNKDIQSDCIKVLYEIGEHEAPEMNAPYAIDFVRLLESKNNRLVWGAMTALDTIVKVQPQIIFENLSIIIRSIEKGSVITIDHGVSLLARLSANKECNQNAFPLLMEQLKRCPIKQLPMYAEKAEMAIISKDCKKQFITLIESRFQEMDKESQKVRINKVMKRLQKPV